MWVTYLHPQLCSSTSHISQKLEQRVPSVSDGQTLRGPSAHMSPSPSYPSFSGLTSSPPTNTTCGIHVLTLNLVGLLMAATTGGWLQGATGLLGLGHDSKQSLSLCPPQPHSLSLSPSLCGHCTAEPGGESPTPMPAVSPRCCCPPSAAHQPQPSPGENRPARFSQPENGHHKTWLFKLSLGWLATQ